MGGFISELSIRWCFQINSLISIVFIVLIDLYSLVTVWPMPDCFDYCSFVIKFEITPYPFLKHISFVFGESALYLSLEDYFW